MQKCFFLICPTDCLEQTINKAFKHENYFYTSLGNSFVYDRKTVEYVRGVVRKHRIEEIYFVLSNDNKIVMDALGDIDFSNIGALNNFYNDIEKQKECTKLFLQNNKNQHAVLSYVLNKKIKELEVHLNFLSNQPIKIRGKIYQRNWNEFIDIYSDLVCLQKHHLN